MSYKFDGSSDYLDVDLGPENEQNLPIAIGLHIKIPDHPYPTAQTAVALCSSNSSFNGSLSLQLRSGVDNQWGARSINSSSSSQWGTYTGAIDGVWTPILMQFGGSGTDCTSQTIYVGSRANVGANTGTSALAAALRYLRIGGIFGGTSWLGAADPNQHRVAHVCVWMGTLSNDQIDQFMGAGNPNVINAANLLAHYDMREGPAQTGGTLTLGDLQAVGALLDAADNPEVASLTVKHLKVLLNPESVGATSVRGAVFSDAVGDDFIGDTKYGTFSGAAISAGTGDDEGYGVLQVEASEWGGGSLAVDTALTVVARNADGQTGVVAGVVIEE